MRRCVLAFFGLVVLLLGGCGGIKGDYGTLSWELVDAPAAVGSFRVHIQRIDVEIAGNWETVAFPDREYELMDLLFEPELIATSALAEGTYTRFRLVVTRATVTDQNGVHDVFVPEIVRTEGVEIDVTWDMESARRTTILMDFNAAMSLLVGPGGYSLDPVVPTVVKEDAGTVSGFANLFDVPASGAIVTARYVAGPNYAAGTLVNTGRAQTDGAFRVWALLPGEYEIEVTLSDGFGGFWTQTVTGVVVAAGGDTNLGVVSL